MLSSKIKSDFNKYEGIRQTHVQCVMHYFHVSRYVREICLYTNTIYWMYAIDTAAKPPATAIVI
jgi:hypothetical protein